MNCLILTHVFIRPTESHKFDIIRQSLKHYRSSNKSLYIIIAGHGIRPPEDIQSMCDHFMWHDNINHSEIGKGHPVLVNECLQHAKIKGFKVITKNRLDCIINIQNFSDFFNSIIDKENKKCLITQQTSFDNFMIGDLLMHGELNFLIDLWANNNWDYSTDGLRNLTYNFCKLYNMPVHRNWSSKAIEIFAFRDRENLRWIDLASNWNRIDMSNELFNDNKYIWGYAQSYNQYVTEKDYYGT